LVRIAVLDGEHQLAGIPAVEALELSEGLAQRQNAQPFCWFRLGQIQFEKCDVYAAIMAYEQALMVDITNVAATESLAAAAAAAGVSDQERAVVLHETLIAIGPAPDLFGWYAEALLALGRRAEAAEQKVLGMALVAETMDRFRSERRQLLDQWRRET
jgi:hypothetical protein